MGRRGLGQCRNYLLSPIQHANNFRLLSMSREAILLTNFLSKRPRKLFFLLLIQISFQTCSANGSWYHPNQCPSLSNEIHDLWATLQHLLQCSMQGLAESLMVESVTSRTTMHNNQINQPTMLVYKINSLLREKSAKPFLAGRNNKPIWTRMLLETTAWDIDYDILLQEPY